jgi:hemoglobin
MNDIQNREDILRLVNSFYDHASLDPLLGPIFYPLTRSDHWPSHITRISYFWEALIFDRPVYNGNAFAPHAHMSLDQHHFDRWINLFHAEIDAMFKGPNADKAKQKSVEISAIFLAKLKHGSSN